MPTPEEIKKIARRFELDMYPTMPDMLSCKAMLEWLADRYCFVEKSDVITEYKKYALNLKQLTEGGYNNSDPDVVLCKGVMTALAALFGKEVFEK